MNFLYHVGETVKIKDNPRIVHTEDPLNFDSCGYMDKYFGTIQVVKEQRNGSFPRYTLVGVEDKGRSGETFHWKWAEDWLEPVDSYEDIEDTEIDELLTK